MTKIISEGLLMNLYLDLCTSRMPSNNTENVGIIILTSNYKNQISIYFQIILEP